MIGQLEQLIDKSETKIFLLIDQYVAQAPQADKDAALKKIFAELHKWGDASRLRDKELWQHRN